MSRASTLVSYQCSMPGEKERELKNRTGCCLGCKVGRQSQGDEGGGGGGGQSEIQQTVTILAMDLVAEKR